jgi:hypothetical protein
MHSDDAVGTRVTSRPPHRTVLAAFPHTVPTSCHGFGTAEGISLSNL